MGATPSQGRYAFSPEFRRAVFEDEPDTATLPASTRRCFDCGIGTGQVCQCTPEFALFEQHEEARREVEDEWLAYIDTLAGERPE